MNFVLSIMVFFSGSAALIFETVLFNQVSLVLGNSIWTSSVVLAGFMCGLGLGNALIGFVAHRIQKKLRAYAFIELCIGVSGLLLVLWLPVSIPVINPLLRLFVDTPWALHCIRLLYTFLVMLLPAAAMGATLPLVVGVLSGHTNVYGSVLGRIYGLNTLGAVIGAVFCQAYSIEMFGILGTGVCAACLNAFISIAAFKLASRDTSDTQSSDVQPSSSYSFCSVWLLVATGLGGAILLALEVVWFRFLILFVLPGSLAFALMLAIVLSGIGFGGLLSSFWLRRRESAYQLCSSIAFIAGISTIVTYALFGHLWKETITQIVFKWYQILLIGLPLLLPVSILSGMLFTLLGESVHRQIKGEIRATGMLTFANTIGAMAGSLIGGFVLVPFAGIERSFFILAIWYGIVALVIELSGPQQPFKARWFRPSIAGLFLLSIIFFPKGFMHNQYLQYVLTRLAALEPSKLVSIQEGLCETILYLQTELYGEPRFHRLVTNSYSMSTTAIQSRRYMQLFVYLPIALHPHPQKALLISYGVGSTAKALTNSTSLQTIDVVDVSKDILELSSIPFPDPQDNPLNDSRVAVHIEDGRFFLQTSTHYFDIITCEPPPPKTAGVVTLFTKEYFKLIRQRLADGGMVTYWLPGHSLEKNETLAIIRAFCEVFPDCTLWSGAGLDFILLGTKDAQGPVSAVQFSKQWHDPLVKTELKNIGVEVPEQLGALFIAGSKELKIITQGIDPLVDNYPKRISDRPVDAMKMGPVYLSWFNVWDTRELFLASTEIQRLWPPSMRLASIPYFEYQANLNELMLGFSRSPAEQLQSMHRIITQTALQTLVLWELGRSVETQQAAQAALSHGYQDVMLTFEEAVSALAHRRFGDAAQLFTQVSNYRPHDLLIQTYRIYATCLDGRIDQARSIAVSLGFADNQNPQIREIWSFFKEQFTF